MPRIGRCSCAVNPFVSSEYCGGVGQELGADMSLGLKEVAVSTCRVGYTAVTVECRGQDGNSTSAARLLQFVFSTPIFLALVEQNKGLAQRRAGQVKALGGDLGEGEGHFEENDAAQYKTM